MTQGLIALVCKYKQVSQAWTTYLNNNEAHSLKYCWRGKATSVTNSECVNVAYTKYKFFFHIPTVHLDIIKVSFIHQLMHQ